MRVQGKRRNDEGNHKENSPPGKSQPTWINQAAVQARSGNAQLTGSDDNHENEPNLDFLNEEIQKSQPKIANPLKLNNQTKNKELNQEMDMESAFHIENL